MRLPSRLKSAPDPGAQNTAWYRQILPRWSRLLWLKCGGTTIIMSSFFVAYFQVLRYPAHVPATMPVTAVDALVPFFAPALLVYASLWIYVTLAPALLLGLRELVTFGLWIVALCSAGLLIFYFWPTAMPPLGIERGHHWGYDILQGVDAAANACPSLHVATAAFSFYWFDRVLKEMNAGAAGRALNGLWLLAIAYSTLATKQHVFIDVVAGFAMGTVFALASLRFRAAVSWEAYARQRGFS